MTIIPLTPSTGGILEPNQVIGRGAEVEEMITILKRQSINLSALRRSGKSSLLSKLNLKLVGLEQFKSVYLEVEGISNCDSFIEKLYLKFKTEKIIKETAIKKIDKAFDSLLGRFSSVELPGGFSAELKTEKAILNHLAASVKINRNMLISELDRLRTDDYLIRKIKKEERTYKFRYEILRKWWKINKSY